MSEIKMGLWAASLLALVAVLPMPALAVPTEFITDGEIGTNLAPSLGSWIPTGTANARGGGDSINMSAGNAGFNNAFISAFAVLGDTSGKISGAPHSGASSISRGFTLPATQDGAPVVTWDVTLSFQTAFDGRNKTTEQGLDLG